MIPQNAHSTLQIMYTSVFVFLSLIPERESCFFVISYCINISSGLGTLSKDCPNDDACKHDDNTDRNRSYVSASQ